MLEHPTLVGVGIDERTAAIVSGGTFAEVIGESTVLVVDARHAKIEPRPAGQPAAARNLTLHVLTAGMDL